MTIDQNQRWKKRQIWQIYLSYSFQGDANFWTMHWNWNREHCAVRSVLSTLWSKHRSDSRVLLTIYQHNNLKILHHQLNLVINCSLNSIEHNNWDLMQSIQPMLNIIVMLLSLINVMKYLLIFILQNIYLL